MSEDSCADQSSVPPAKRPRMGDSGGALPSLRTREEVQGYITGLADQLGVSLDDGEIAAELDKRDQLARFRSQFHYPTVGELLEKEDSGGCGCLYMYCYGFVISFSHN